MPVRNSIIESKLSGAECQTAQADTPLLHLVLERNVILLSTIIVGLIDILERVIK